MPPKCRPDCNGECRISRIVGREFAQPADRLCKQRRPSLMLGGTDRTVENSGWVAQGTADRLDGSRGPLRIGGTGFGEGKIEDLAAHAAHRLCVDHICTESEGHRVRDTVHGLCSKHPTQHLKRRVRPFSRFWVAQPVLCCFDKNSMEVPWLPGTEFR